MNKFFTKWIVVPDEPISPGDWFTVKDLLSGVSSIGQNTSKMRLIKQCWPLEFERVKMFLCSDDKVIGEVPTWMYESLRYGEEFDSIPEWILK